MRAGKAPVRLRGLWFACVIGTLIAVLFAGAPSLRAGTAEAKLAVATESKRASAEAMDQLMRGGNAVDAAVTAALVGGVTNSSSSGIGGGAFIHYFDQKSGRNIILDARETAPAKLVAAEFEARPFPTENRGKYVGVPGEVAGLYALHQRYGKRSWAEVVAPAVKAAADGFSVEPHTAKALGHESAAVKRDPGLSDLWIKKGRLAEEGDRIKNPALAKTLARIAEQGPKALYQGAIAADIVNTARATGGALSLSDLAAYQVKERTPLVVKWGDYEVVTMPPPSAGGLMLAQALKLFTIGEYKKLGHNTPAFQHALAESFRASIADRIRFVSDPDQQPVDLSALLADQRMAARRRMISLDRTHAIPRFKLEEHGTHHLVTADAAGNVVSLTTTVNRGFGAKLTARTSGIVLNDELNDYSSQNLPAEYGSGPNPNRPRPGSRPVSSMTPTIVLKDGKVVLAVGGSGGMTIATNVAQAVVSQLTFGISPQALVASPRFQVPTNGAFISVERGTPASTIADLERRGEIVDLVSFNTSALQMLTIDGQGRKSAGADPRKHGVALVR